MTYVRVVSARFYPTKCSHIIKEDAYIAGLNTTTTPGSTEITAVSHLYLKTSWIVSLNQARTVVLLQTLLLT
jgi:hypothetical protein